MRNSKTILEYESRKSQYSYLCPILSNLSKYSLEDLDKMNYLKPSHRKMLKELIKELEASNQRDLDIDLSSDRIEKKIIYDFIPNYTGDVYEYIGSTKFISSIEIKTGSLVWLTKIGMFYKHIQINRIPSIQLSHLASNLTRGEYDSMIQNSYNSIPDQIIEIRNQKQSSNFSHLSNYGVKIF